MVSLGSGPFEIGFCMTSLIWTRDELGGGTLGRLKSRPVLPGSDSDIRLLRQEAW